MTLAYGIAIMRINFVMVACAVFSALPAIGLCGNYSVELPQRVRAAVERDARLQRGRSQVEASSARIDGASAAYLPALSWVTRSSHNNRWGDVAQIASDEDRGRVNSLQLTWNVFRSGGDLFRVAETKADHDAEQYALRQIRLEVLGRVAENAIEYRKSSALILIAGQYRDQSLSFSKRLERSVQLGQSSTLELERALARNEDGLQNIHEFVVQHEISALELQKFFDFAPDKLLPPLVDLSTLSLPAPEDAELPWCRPGQPVNTPAIIRRESELLAQKHRISVARAQYGPQVDLRVTRNDGRHYYAGIQGDLAETRAEITLTIPLFDGWRTSTQVREAAALSAQAQADLDAARSDAVVNWEKKCVKWQAARLSAANAENAWHRMARIMAGLERERQLGFKNSVDILDIARDQFSVARQFVEHAYEARRMLIQLRLLEANGADDDAHLHLITAILNTI